MFFIFQPLLFRYRFGIPKTSQMSSKTLPKSIKNCIRKSFQKIFPKWSILEPKLTPKWSPNPCKIHQNRHQSAHMDQDRFKCPQISEKSPKMEPKRAASESFCYRAVNLFGTSFGCFVVSDHTFRAPGLVNLIQLFCSHLQYHHLPPHHHLHPYHQHHHQHHCHCQLSSSGEPLRGGEQLHVSCLWNVPEHLNCFKSMLQPHVSCIRNVSCLRHIPCCHVHNVSRINSKNNRENWTGLSIIRSTIKSCTSLRSSNTRACICTGPPYI